MMVSVNDISPGLMVETIYSLTEAAINNVRGKKAIHAQNKMTVPMLKLKTIRR